MNKNQDNSIFSINEIFEEQEKHNEVTLEDVEDFIQEVDHTDELNSIIDDE